MNSRVTVRLNLSVEQTGQLRRLQAAFAEACNFIAPMVVQTRCWNRVGLHHLAYRPLRERFAPLGSQMACNAVYSVSRACRMVYQHPKSKWFVGRKPSAPLPQLHFPPTSPVFFDRHTLSLKGGRLSMFTLDGRLRFHVALEADVEHRFAKEKLKEVILVGNGSHYALNFAFTEPDALASPLGDEPEYEVEVQALEQAA
jgi:hypothetical protein